mmetsp:Transcript_29609/g.62949  ORF Transcript_29609/g.62949 Transcript_29609/m.62949 type:complete len:204 (-) Transcript_29609:1446-2057(-)
MRSLAILPRLSTVQATSSISIEVPVGLAPPTTGMRPFLAFQYTLYSSATLVKGKSSMPILISSVGPMCFSLHSRSTTALIRSSRSAASGPVHSIRSEAASGPLSLSRLTSLSISSSFSNSRRDALSKSSTAEATSCCLSLAAASQAISMSGKSTKQLALSGYSSTVLKVTLETKARVPSLPIISFFRICMGSEGGASTSALME